MLATAWMRVSRINLWTLNLPEAFTTATVLSFAVVTEGRQSLFRLSQNLSMAREELIAPMIVSICALRTMAGEAPACLPDASPATEGQKPAKPWQYYFADWFTFRLFCTSKTPGTPLDRRLARSLSPWLFTTPSSATRPPFTIM